MDKTNYTKLVEKVSPPSKKGRDFICAFLIGGLICSIGQVLREIFFYLGFSEDAVGMSVSSILIFTAALLTGLDIFE